MHVAYFAAVEEKGLSAVMIHCDNTCQTANHVTYIGRHSGITTGHIQHGPPGIGQLRQVGYSAIYSVHPAGSIYPCGLYM